MESSFFDLKSIVFDLDGTLYRNDGLLNEMRAVAEGLVAQSRGLGQAEARRLLQASRQRKTEAGEDEPTLTHTCRDLGLSVRELHQTFERQLRPESYLNYDPVLQALLEALEQHFSLHIYTNNNLFLTRKILALLGIDHLFRHLFTIEFSWEPKPDPETLDKVIAAVGDPPESILFVGDRPHIDLDLPQRLGAKTMLMRDSADLLQIFQATRLLP